VNSVRNGRVLLEDAPGVWFSHGLADTAEQIDHVAAAYVDAVRREGASNVMLLMSRRKGDAAMPGWNTTYANAVLRQMCNPDGRKIAGTNLHTGDRVIIRVNAAYEQRGSRSGITERVVNGDVGTIRGLVMADSKGMALRSLLPEWIDVELDDGRMINLPGTAMATLGHAYALTVHSAQGSEYKEVIFVVTPGHANFVNRTMLLTGLSRARESLRVFGRDEDLRSIAATPAPERNSALLERVNAVLADFEGQRRAPERQRA
jgi:exodeoxyribonuclease V alpha subunit